MATTLSEAERQAFGRRIAKARAARGWTQSDLAEACAVSRTATVSDWETGTTLPDQDLLMRLPEILGVNANWLLLDKGQMTQIDESEAVRRLAIIRAVASGESLDDVRVVRAIVSAVDAADPPPAPAARKRRRG